MHFRALIAVTFAAFALAQDEQSIPKNYPRDCAKYCGPPVTVARQCGEEGIECVCGTKRMPHLIPLCEACTSAISGDSEAADYSRTMTRIRNQCGFEEATREFESGASTPAIGAGAIAVAALLAAL
ncbi:hypothetical protein LTR37_005244 [Vermiconidia calcicola]|uniref:Uncharacterized protein n=1 Tax=Vermiconidia calcicola TaxID=1690605 RepID=A0ACC3NJF3_9PEZI|nr:hypothetical protein LTR37_005244 [Vermiconidia calcicola]